MTAIRKLHLTHYILLGHLSALADHLHVLFDSADIEKHTTLHGTNLETEDACLLTLSF